MFQRDHWCLLEITGILAITAFTGEFAKRKAIMIIGHYVKVCQAKMQEGF